MKKIFLMIFTLGMSLLLVACSAQKEETGTETGTGTEDKKEQTELLVWWWGEGDTPGSKAWLEETVEKYKEVEPDVTITLVEQTSDQLYPAWESAIQSGDGADIQFLWTGSSAIPYIWTEDVADITEYVSEDELAHWTNLEGLSYDGKPYLCPWYQISIVMMYNKDMFREAGLDPENPPADWEELLDACEKLKDTGVIPLELGGMKDGWGTPWVYAIFAPAAHDSIREFIEAGVTPGSFLTEEHMDWLEKVSVLIENGYTNPMVMSNDFYQGRESFLRGESAIGIATNGQAIQWMEEMGGEDKVGIMEIPVMGSGKLAGKLNNQAHSFAIPAYAEHKQEAADFLVFMHQPEQLKSWYEHTKNFPCDDRFDISWITTDSEKFIYDQLQNNSVAYPEIYIPVQVDTEGVYAAMQMLFSGSTPQEASEYIENTAEKWRGLDAGGVEGFTEWAAVYQD